jgi:hypothetical protein
MWPGRRPGSLGAAMVVACASQAQARVRTLSPCGFISRLEAAAGDRERAAGQGRTLVRGGQGRRGRSGGGRGCRAAAGAAPRPARGGSAAGAQQVDEPDGHALRLLADVGREVAGVDGLLEQVDEGQGLSQARSRWRMARPPVTAPGARCAAATERAKAVPAWRMPRASPGLRMRSGWIWRASVWTSWAMATRESGSECIMRESPFVLG